MHVIDIIRSVDKYITNSTFGATLKIETSLQRRQQPVFIIYQ